jgi:phosphatidylglycerol lysyltransferase
MKTSELLHFIYRFFKERSVPLIRENGKIISQFVFTTLFIGIGIWFIKHERDEFFLVDNVLFTANWLWVALGLGITILLIFLQSLMYQASFAAVHCKVSLTDTLVLFLKRNFISVFLPVGGVSSLMFFVKPIEKKGINESQIYFASSIYAFVGIVSVVIVAFPVFLYALLKGAVGYSEWYALGAVVLLLYGFVLLYRSIMQKGILYKWILKVLPQSVVFLSDLQNNKIDKKTFFLTVFYSILIDIAGFIHLYIAMAALHCSPSIFAAIMGYIISVIFLIISPFLRGLGAIEVSMSYCLIHFGFGNVEAIAITFLYRFFEFWTPLIAGAFTFLLKINRLLLRIGPALLLLFLGILNIISVITPAKAERLARVIVFLPIEAVHVSNYLVIIAGFFLLVTAAFMLKGLRTAWWFALILCSISVIGHLTKAIDFEEAFVAFLIIVILLVTHKEYYIKNNPRLRFIGLKTTLLSIAFIILYGSIGFYFIDKRYFNVDFSLMQSITYTLQNYFLVGSADLVPVEGFAAYFLVSIKVSGGLSLGFLIYTLIRPYIFKNNISTDEYTTAKALLTQYGCSGLDYFKTYFDKLLFFSQNKKAFIAYRVSGNFAVVLENPVAENQQEMKQCIAEFDVFCYERGLKSVFYRVPEESLAMYRSLGKRYLFIGQEAIVNLATFSLEGGSKKSLRNALHKISDIGLKVTVHTPPIKDGVLQKLKSVSEEWLHDTERKEIIFSQGMFLWDELKMQPIITIENAEEKIIAFLNIIPDYASGEGTYDLIRKTNDAPNGVIDFIIVELFNYLKSQQYTSVNLGFAPMSGIDEPHNFPEKSMKFAYEKIKTFSHYKSLRDFKEKFSPQWKNEYIIYSHDYDLLQVPTVLSNVIKQE